jgi:hypothetical protein
MEAKHFIGTETEGMKVKEIDFTNYEYKRLSIYHINSDYFPPEYSGMLVKMYGEEEPGEDERENYIDSTGVLHMKPVMYSFNSKYAPRVVSAHTGFEVVGRVL